MIYNILGAEDEMELLIRIKNNSVTTNAVVEAGSSWFLLESKKPQSTDYAEPASNVQINPAVELIEMQ